MSFFVYLSLCMPISWVFRSSLYTGISRVMEREDRRPSFRERYGRIFRVPGATTLIRRHLFAYVSDPRVEKFFLHDYNKALVAVLNSMLASSRPMMADLRKLQIIQKFLELNIALDPIDIQLLFRQTVSYLGLRRLLGYGIFGRINPNRSSILSRSVPVLAATRTSNCSPKVTYLLDESSLVGRSVLFWTPPFNLLPLVVRTKRKESW